MMLYFFDSKLHRIIFKILWLVYVNGGYFLWQLIFLIRNSMEWAKGLFH